MQVDYNNLSKKERQQLRNERIRKHYEQLESVTELGVQKYSKDYILTKVALEAGLAASTVEHIVYYRNGYN